VDTRKRLIDLIAVPYEEETEVPWKGEIWNEVFDRGSFLGIEDHAGRVMVNKEHRKGATIGKAVRFDSKAEDGLLTRVKVARTDLGDETLALAEDEMISPSIGFYVKSYGDVQLNRRTKVRRILRAFVDHLAMVEQPAYAGARVLSVRDRDGSTEPRKTPLIDEFLEDEVLLWATERLSSK
jgi:phage head maturation protease